MTKLTPHIGVIWIQLQRSKHPWFDSNSMRVKAEMLKSKNKRQEALTVLRESLKIETARNNTRGASTAAYDLALYYREIDHLDSAIDYGLFANEYGCKNIISGTTNHGHGLT